MEDYSTGDSALGIRLQEKVAYPSKKAKLIALTVVFVSFFGMLLWHFYELTLRQVWKELRKRTEHPLHLSWTEFTTSGANALEVIAMWADVIMLSAAAFHPMLPNPKIKGFSSLAEWMLAAHLPPHRPHVLFQGLLLTFISVWSIAWIPVAGKKLSARLRALLHQNENNSQRLAIKFLFQFMSAASIVSLIAFIPTMTTLLEIISCSSLVSHETGCRNSQSMIYLAVPCTILFYYLAPYAPGCKSFPFGHPPYRRDLDVRYKRVYQYVLYGLYFVQIACWKIFINNPFHMLVSTMTVQFLVAILTATSAPCVYGNINRMRLFADAVPIWSGFCSLLQIIRYGGDSPRFICDDGDIVFPVLLFAGWALLFIAGLWSTRRTRSSQHPLETDPSAALHLQAIKDNRLKMEEYKLDMYNTGNRRESQRISALIVGLEHNERKLLDEHRRKKEHIALPYYLGETVGKRLLDDFEWFPDPEEGDTPLNEITSKIKQPSSPPRMEVDLTFEQMENFIPGPPLGRGSYGSVFMGMLPDGRLVAVKEVEISRKHKKEQLAQVKKEVNVLRTLEHPNIIRYFGAHATGRTMRVFMEFAVGGSLTSLVRKFESLSEPLAKQYTHQILCGLEYLHAQHVVHRDIKGENILIDGQGVAKLADFGCSKGLSDIANKSREGCASLVGSPYWMAPEVIRNEAYGTKADIWSVGCTVVEVLNGGNPPWHEKFDNIYTAMYFIGTTTDLPSNIPETVSDTCKHFLARCFDRDVSTRASASELLNHPWITESSPTDSSETKAAGRQWSDMFESDTMVSGESRGTTLASSHFASTENLGSLPGSLVKTLREDSETHTAPATSPSGKNPASSIGSIVDE